MIYVETEWRHQLVNAEFETEEDVTVIMCTEDGYSRVIPWHWLPRKVQESLMEKYYYESLEQDIEDEKYELNRKGYEY